MHPCPCPTGWARIDFMGQLSAKKIEFSLLTDFKSRRRLNKMLAPRRITQKSELPLTVSMALSILELKASLFIQLDPKNLKKNIYPLYP